MPDEKLLELIERVERLDGPDRTVDADLYTTLVGLQMYESIYERSGDLVRRVYADPTGPSYYHLPRYTASLDACLALVERVRPGQQIEIVEEALERVKQGYFAESFVEELTLAVLSALLRSIQSEKSP